ncbi:MAG: hypothetical protein HYS13_14150 [Planctomycetia bacterium]|nr:hypothetical protein [Planctomycetia bacterium]
MTDIRRALKGVIHGKTIELADDPGLPEGQIVTVIVQPEGVKSLEGLLRSAGACADEADDLDAYMAWNRQQRKAGTH